MPPNPQQPLTVLTADQIIATTWPDPPWIIPGILTSGLVILAGKQKIGKSWWSLQVAQAVGSGGLVFGKQLQRRSVLYIALEDTPQRIKKRMILQKWPSGADVDFITIGNFSKQIGNLLQGGVKTLENQIKLRKYQIVFMDTLSRVIPCDQNDVKEMTKWLSPLQVLAHTYNLAICLIDHHNKQNRPDKDVVDDILGSTAKGAMADTIIGLYRERGKPGAKLRITGRDVEDQELSLNFDSNTGTWELAGTKPLTPFQSKLLATLRGNGPSTPTELEKILGVPRSTIYHQLAAFEQQGLVKKVGRKWEVI